MAASALCCSLLEGLIRLSCLRYIVATVCIQLELYWYKHQKNRTCAQNMVLLIGCATMFVVLPLYVIVLVNDLIISLWFKIVECCSSDVPLIDHNLYSDQQANIIHFMCFNIQNGQGMDGQINIDRTCSMINKHSIDILAMQEVEWESTLYAGNQTIDIGNSCNMRQHDVVSVRKQYWGGWYGDGLCTKYKILDRRTYAFPKWTYRNPRKAQAVKVDIGESRYIWVVNTHLQNDPTFDENWYQIRNVVRVCDEIVAGCKEDKDFYGLILCGDFNLPAISSPIQYLKYQMVHCVQGATFPSKNPLVQIDHIFLHRMSRIKCVVGKSRVVEDDLLSDHRPVVTAFSV